MTPPTGLEFDAPLFKKPPHAMHTAILDAPLLGQVALCIRQLRNVPSPQFGLQAGPGFHRQARPLARWSPPLEQRVQPAIPIRRPPALEVGATVAKQWRTRCQTGHLVAFEQAQQLHTYRGWLTTQVFFEHGQVVFAFRDP